jgi:tetratricopeptide (TPR) repeat protein
MRNNLMATKKENSKAEVVSGASTRAYEMAVAEFQTALELLHKGEFAAARERFARIAESAKDEPALAQRARSFTAVCERRMAPPAADPQTADGLYYEAVLHSNEGRADEAIALLDRALEQEIGSARVLYARASAWALKGNTEAAVADLRQAIAVEPTVRFQAANDSDFSQIREEPAFIDIIEPASAGA